MKATVYFVSDTHFTYHSRDEVEREKRAAFLSFLENARGAERLYLAGDIFDFWFEYRHVVPAHYTDILRGLARLRESGTRILLMRGNHDGWYGRHLVDTCGIELLPDVVDIDLQGRRIRLTHGDLALPGDIGYKILRLVIRSRPVVFLAGLLHPDLLYGFAGFFSRASKGITHAKTEAHARRLRETAPRRFFETGNDVFVMGHIHLPCLDEHGDRLFVILGDWETHRSLLRLEDGRFSLEFYERPGNTLKESR